VELCIGLQTPLGDSGGKTNLSLQVDQPYKTPTINSLSGAFMSVDKLFKVATTQTPTGDCIPQGVKENVYFVINDTENRIRRQNKKGFYMVDQLAEISLLPQHYNQSQNLSTVDQNYLILNERRQDHMFVARGERKCLFCNK
jgi:hypothetical protein